MLGNTFINSRAIKVKIILIMLLNVIFSLKNTALIISDKTNTKPCCIGYCKVDGSMLEARVANIECKNKHTAIIITYTNIFLSKLI